MVSRSCPPLFRSLLLALPLILLLPLGAPAQTARTLEFRFEAGWILLPVHTDEDERLWIMDTGAGCTVVDSTYARQLGLSFGERIPMTGATQMVRAATLSPPALEVGGLRFQGRQAIALDLLGLVADRHGLRPGGILGIDFLRRFVVEVDYAGRAVTFHDPEAFAYEGEGVVFEEALVDGIFKVPVCVDGRHRGDFAVDLGAAGVSFHYPFAEAEGLLDRPGVVMSGRDAGGDAPRKVSRFESIELAGVVLEDPLLDIPRHPGGAFGRPHFDGNAGSPLFRHFVLYLDYPGERIILEKGADCCAKEPDLLAGVRVGLDQDGRLVVEDVIPGSCVEEAGVCTGDVVRGVDGQLLSCAEGLKAFRTALRTAPGAQVRLLVERAGILRERELVLRDVFSPAGEEPGSAEKK